MHLDDQTPRPCRSSCQRHWLDQLTQACAMAGVDDDRQMGQLPREWQAFKSSVNRVAVSKLRMPRSQRTT